MLLTAIGPEIYGLVRKLVPPRLQLNVSFQDLIALLKKHFNSEPLVIAERYHFWGSGQKLEESIADYMAELRKRASRCRFGAFLSEGLQDGLVYGI